MAWESCGVILSAQEEKALWLPASEIKTTGRGKFAPPLIGCMHIDIAELRLAESKLNMFLAIDRVARFTCIEFRDDLGKVNGADFLRGVIKAFPPHDSHGVDGQRHGFGRPPQES